MLGGPSLSAQLLPFHRSASGMSPGVLDDRAPSARRVNAPTVTQSAAETQDTWFRTVPVAPRGTEMVCTVHRLPSHDSVKAVFTSPTE